MTRVVAALIWEKGKFMICQRPPHKMRGLLWEFVGGKVEPGETKQQALIRECHEELDVTVAVGDKYMKLVHEYPDLTVELTLFNCAIAEGTPQKIEHNDIKWITPLQISEFDFCPADEEILARITRDYAETEKKKELFLRQKHTLDTFLTNGAISQAQYDTSYNGLVTKMGLQNAEFI